MWMRGECVCRPLGGAAKLSEPKVGIDDEFFLNWGGAARAGGGGGEELCPVTELADDDKLTTMAAGVIELPPTPCCRRHGCLRRRALDSRR